MSSAFGKCSIAFLLRRIIGPNTFWRKWFLYTNTGIYMAASIVSSVIAFCQCKPAKAIWMPVPGSKCWDPKVVANFDIFQSCECRVVLVLSSDLTSCSLWRSIRLLPRPTSHYPDLGLASYSRQTYRNMHSFGAWHFVSVSFNPSDWKLNLTVQCWSLCSCQDSCLKKSNCTRRSYV
jgi:hypothetical protein